MRPLLLAGFLLLHALAHAGAGMWAAGRASPWIVIPLWLVSMGGFLFAACAIFGVERLRRRAEVVTFAATFASAGLLRLAGIGLWSLLGLAIGLAFCALVRWWARCTHPEIHTPTFTTGDYPIVLDRPRLRDRLGAGVAYGALAVTAVLIVARPWHMAWGTTASERAVRVAPATPFEEAPAYRVDHGVTVHAPADRVWPWLAQLGQDRAGFYSYDWLERAFGDEVHNVDSLVPTWQSRQVGDLVRATQPDYLGGRFGTELGWRITEWDPPRSMTLDQWGRFVVVPVDSATSRLLVHTRGPGRPSFAAIPLAALGFYLLEPAHFIMERGMLLGIKARAERASVRDP
ncbi:MAG: hypothetical protein IPN16_21415 [Gemmatimonadetes bacterium]|nr:hypothetical protein [Gemmatimonadota bacterium]MBK8649048.1 hypothetical protein [Gemmatimonadota bacterium]